MVYTTGARNCICPGYLWDTLSLFQRFATACLEDVRLATSVEGVAYLDNWLLYDSDPHKLATAVEVIRALGITINEEKSTLEPSHSLVYLGFRIDTRELEIIITRAAHGRLCHYLRLYDVGRTRTDKG